MFKKQGVYIVWALALVPVLAGAQAEVSTGEKGILSFGIHPELIMANFEHFDKNGNERLLAKNYLEGTSSYDRQGRIDRTIHNYFIGGSLLYRRVDTSGNYWGIGVEYGQGNAAISHTALEAFSWPGLGSVTGWVNWYKFNRASLSMQKAWGESTYQKRYLKFKVSYFNLGTLNGYTGNYTEEWINKENSGAIWKGSLLTRHTVTFTPEIGLQYATGKNKNALFQMGVALQLGAADVYKLEYYKAISGKPGPHNSITSKGNYFSVNFSLQLPVLVHQRVPKSEKEKPPRKEPEKPVVRQFSQNNLVFLLDVSISMNSGGKLQLLKDYIEKMLDSLPPDDYITLITFSGAAKVVLEPTQAKDKEEIIAQLQRLTIHGSTNINRGLELAYNVLDKKHIRDGNNRIIIATDGEFTASPKTKEMVKNKFDADNKVVLSVFHFMESGGAKSSNLSELANLGGGNYATIDKDNIHSSLEVEYKQKVK